MKLLFLVDQVDYPFAPNPVLARRTAGQLAAMGHMVHLLELYDGQTLPPDPPEGCRAFLLPFSQGVLAAAGAPAQPQTYWRGQQKQP